MAGYFSNLTKQLPEGISGEARLYSTENVMMAKSRTYITGVEIYNTDYSFSFPVSTPPPTIIENREYHFQKGRIILFQPDSRIIVKKSVPAQEYFTLFFKQEYLESILEQISKNRNLSFRYNEYFCTTKLRSLVRNLEAEMSGPAQDRCSLMLQSMTIQIAVELLRQTEACENRNTSCPKLRPHYVEDAVEYIRANFNSDIRIDDISRFINLSSYYFIRTFKEHTGQTPHEYLLRTRLEHARELLKTGGCSVGEVARECGFVNPAHFAACFRRVLGISPTEYGRRHNPV